MFGGKAVLRMSATGPNAAVIFGSLSSNNEHSAGRQYPVAGRFLNQS